MSNIHFILTKKHKHEHSFRLTGKQAHVMFAIVNRNNIAAFGTLISVFGSPQFSAWKVNKLMVP